MVLEYGFVEEKVDNGCYPLCACGCRRPIFQHDRVLQTDKGLFLVPKPFYNEDRVLI